MTAELYPCADDWPQGTEPQRMVLAWIRGSWETHRKSFVGFGGVAHTYCRMHPTDDSTLLRQYVETRSDEAFATLVARHINLVYSVAMRCVGDPHQAEEIAQSVFILLANKAATLRHDKALSSWLFQTTRLTASNFIRSETRRHRRELEAHMHSQLDQPDRDLWQRIAPLLDDAVAELNDPDRRAILLRFYEGKSLREVGIALDASEDAAQKRLARAVEQLREYLAKRRISVGTSGLAVIISANAVQSAPVGLAVTISTSAALAGTTFAATTTATAAKVVAMTTLQKTFIGAILVAAVCIGIFGYKSRRASIPPLVTATPEVENAVVETIRPATVVEPVARPDNPPQPAPTARKLYERALVHLTEERHDDALADLTSSIALLEKGVGRWQWSPTLGAPARDHRFDSLVAAYFSRSGVLADKKDYASAIADLTRLLEFEPKSYSARFNRAQYFSYLGQRDAAIAEFSLILEDPDIDFSSYGSGKEKAQAMTYQYRGLNYKERKEYERAVADFTESLRLDPSGGDGMIIYWHRGLAYRALQQFDRALDDANHLSEWALQWATSSGNRDSERDRAETAARFGSEIFNHQQPYQLEVLAAVQAKVGDFTLAVREQERAMKLLTPHLEAQRPAMQARLDLYKAGKPLMGE